MTQYDLGFIDPNETSGVELAAMLSNFNSALRSAHKGASRPAYAERGTIWVQDTGATVLNMFFFDGVDDILIGTINTTTNAFTVSGASVTLAALGGVPTTRAVLTGGSLLGGGNLTSDRGLYLKGDHDSPPAGHYYGTNQAGTQGWFPLASITSQVSGGRVNYTQFGPGTSYFTAPAGVTSLLYVAWSGGGGNVRRTDRALDGGDVVITSDVMIPGGWGACSTGTVSLIPGTAYPVTVGDGGVYQHMDLGAGSSPYDLAGGVGGTTQVWGNGPGNVPTMVSTMSGGTGAAVLGGSNIPGIDGATTLTAGFNVGDWAAQIQRGRAISGSPGNVGFVQFFWNY